jgi:hypothetical protein
VAEQNETQIRQTLRQIARTASVMFDGELCHTIITPRCMEWLGKEPDAEDRFAIGDNIDFDAPTFETAKKVLLRLQRLAPEGLAVECCLWVPVTSRPDSVTVAVYNGGPSHWWKWGKAYLPMAEPMRAAMQSGAPLDVPPEDSGLLTVLAPVRDSLKEVTGLIEVSAAAPKAG